MRLDVRILLNPNGLDLTDDIQDPAVQKATGETDPIGVIKKLREMKNNFK